MGASDKKTTSTQNTVQNSTATSTPNVPDWLLQPAQGMATGLGGLIARNNAGAFTPTESALQRQATATAGNLTTSPLLAQAAGQVGGINYDPSQVGAGHVGSSNVTAGHIGSSNVTGQSLLDGLEKYYNPFKDQVLNPVLNDYDTNSGRVRAAQSAHEAATGSFRGSRSGIMEGATEGELARGRATTEGGLLGDMFNTATTLSGEDASRRQAAMTGNADRLLTADTTNVGNTLAADTGNANRALTADTGNADRDLAASTTNASNGLLANGQRLTGAGLLAGIGNDANASNLNIADLQARQGAAQTGIENAITNAPLTNQAQLEGLFGGLDPSLFTGSTVNSNGTTNTNGTSTTSDPMGGLGTVLKAAGLLAAPFTGGLSTLLDAGGLASVGSIGAFASDRRLKRCIHRLGTRPDGLGVYSFRYLWSKAVRVGVMAQEVLKVKPEAVIAMPNGFLAVDYGQLA